MSNGATSDLSSSDETSHGDARLTVSPHPDVPQDTPTGHTPAKPDPITTTITTATAITTTTTFDDHIVIKEVVPSGVGINYKSLTVTPKPSVVTPVKPIPTHSPPKAPGTATPMNKILTVSAASSPPQAVVPRGSSPSVPQGLLNVINSSPTTTHKAERSLPAAHREKVQENGKIRSESEDVSS
ncbi:hypothetical protein Hamer_G029836 [Homarus americanus]|uniref:Uncharacterized protein n=1 Tax=Homarus americanus TaxID=6706 RepID=A0A8J5MXS0_HOMAM|nr:hypothetical protein Hamer_G029836 [Homarus americanus]